MNKMKKKIFISLPMTGRRDETIQEDIQKTSEFLQSMEYEPVHSYTVVDESAVEDKNKLGLSLLGQAFIKMADCDAVYMCDGWRDSRGCRLEHDAAFDYGLEIYFEGDML